MHGYAKKGARYDSPTGSETQERSFGESHVRERRFRNPIVYMCFAEKGQILLRFSFQNALRLESIK